MRRFIGSRFTNVGRERSALVGTVTAAGATRTIRINRSQDTNGETVSIALGGGPASLFWSDVSGALSGDQPAVGDERRLIERITLDSPDQFILAQLRGASYYTVATNVVSEEALQSQSVNRAWDAVRVEEPSRAGLTRPESPWRMYFINSSTGLIERIVSSELGQPIIAELSDWVSQQGELIAGRIRWSRNNQLIMQLVVTGAAYGPK
jgi:hypothetical protein